MLIKQLLVKNERGYVNFLVIFLLLLVSVIFISYMELGQTHFKSSTLFKETKTIENKAKSNERYISNNLPSDLDELFTSRLSNHVGNESQYLISINSSPLDSKLFLPSSIEPRPFFYQSFYDFTGYDFYYSNVITNGITGYGFISETNCVASVNSTHCRKFKIVNVVTQLEKILNVSSKEVQYNFTLSYDINGNTVTNYNGYEVVKEVSGQSRVLSNLSTP